MGTLTTNGRFFSTLGERITLRGVTLGPFPPERPVIDELQSIAQSGANMVRLYEPPEQAFLDRAYSLGIHVFTSVPWGWGADFLSNKSHYEGGYLKIRDYLSQYATHPALAGIYIANEIPSELVRWMGAHDTKLLLERLIQHLKHEFPTVLYAYANYPSTEYLELENADFTAFNLYLEEAAPLTSYLQHLHTIAGERPLMVSEFGVDALSTSEHTQREILHMALRSAHQLGVQGVTIFAWSDLWYNRGQLVAGWHFGLHRIDSSPRPALSGLFDCSPEREPDLKVSVIVCSYNGAERLPECLRSLTLLKDSSYEVLVINDGSSDRTERVAESFAPLFQAHHISYRVITQPNLGLSAARNTGATHARGEILAYTDDDAYPDPDWLYWLRASYTDGVGMVGGLGIPPTRTKISDLPGQACPVLLTDTTAEHLPGCNMSVTKAVWSQVGGFNTRYRVAGDDVDFCWRVIDQGYTLAYAANAIVWHQPRPTYRTYLRQQWGYGKAEALLYQDHPERFSHNGISWQGGVYDGSPTTLTAQSVVYSGLAGNALFQPILESYESPMGRTQRIIRRVKQTYALVRFIARSCHGYPFSLRTFTRRRRPELPEYLSTRTEQYWSTHIQYRADLIALFAHEGWEPIEDPIWDLSLGDALLCLALEQPAQSGQLLHIEFTTNTDPSPTLATRGWRQL